MQNECECGCCSDVHLNDYDEIIAQLKETRDNIDKMITSLEHRKVKDSVINQILNSDYEEEDCNVDIIDELESILKEVKTNPKPTEYTLSNHI